MPPESLTASEDEPLKLSFVLTEDQAGPFPVSTETLWCRPEGGNYRVKNVPFFIDEISLDDLIAVRALGDGYFEIDSVIAPSQNSTIWLFFKNGAEENTLIDKLLSMGCGIEGGVIDGYYAINVPNFVDIDLVYLAIDEAENDGAITADYPSIRH
jgi:hypothetical protein